MRISDWSSDVCSSDLGWLAQIELVETLWRYPRHFPVQAARRHERQVFFAMLQHFRRRLPVRECHDCIPLRPAEHALDDIVRIDVGDQVFPGQERESVGDGQGGSRRGDWWGGAIS